jgi:signal transduction histidine kinase
MSIRGRLLTSFGIVAALLVLPLAYGLQQLRAMRGIAMALRTEHAEAYAALGTLREGLAEYDRNARSYVITRDPAFRSGAAAALARAADAMARLTSVGYGREAAPLAASLESLDGGTRSLERLLETGRAEEATAFLGGAVQPALATAQAAIPPLGNAIGRAGTEAALAAQEITAAALRTATVASGLALLLGAGVALWVTAALTGPLGRLRRNMASVAGGTMAAGTLPYHRTDEIGELCRSFGAMTQRLAELDRMRGEFLNVVSHDLKAPLTLIRGCAELIEEVEPSELGSEQRELVRSIREHVGVLAKRVDQLLSLGRLEARAYPLHPEEIPVVPTFETLRAAYERQARHQGILLAMRIEPSAPAIIRADPDGLHHEIVGNLLSNALKFTPVGGTITVRVWGEAEELRFSVADTGVGIPADELPWVFTKYYQADGSRGGLGTGLGLAIARQVVEAHGGRISVQSAQPGGSVFEVSLPVRGPLTPLPEARTGSAPPAPVTRGWPVPPGARRTPPWRSRPAEVVAGGAGRYDGRDVNASRHTSGV